MKVTLSTLVNVLSSMKQVQQNWLVGENTTSRQMSDFMAAMYDLQAEIKPFLENTRVEVERISQLDDDEQYEIDNLKRTDMAVYQAIRDMKVKHEQA